MSWFQPEIKHRHVFMLYNIQKDSVQSQLQSFPQNPPPAPLVSSNAETSPAMLFIIVILAIIFFISGLLHLLARFIMRYRPSSSDFPSNPDMSNSGTFQRQLHHLFNLHDSGLDQEFIDALPVFQYKEILGLKEPFDCAVCLCEFSEQDKLRLLPLCSHAFHVECIDTWLLSNSTCPLCRGALYTPGLNTKNPVFNFKDWREEDGALGLPSNGGDNCGITIDHKPNEEEIVVEKRKVFSIILGKYRSSSDEGNGRGMEDRDAGESSSNNLYARRCFSMGSYQYVVADSELQVALSSNQIERNGDQRIFKARAGQWRDQSSVDEDFKGKKISAASKNESFSVSKIWLWSKKDRFCGSSNTHIGDHASETPVVTSFTWRNVT